MTKWLAAIVATSLACAARGQEPVPPHFHFGGFANVSFDHSSRTHETAFATGELDLYANAAVNDAWSMLGEAFVQHTGSIENVDPRPTKRVEAEIERLYISYNPSDRIRFELGRNHTGIIRWNQREHRGRFLQTPIDVPAIANREEQGGAWPLHFLGIWASGRLPGRLGLQYSAATGKARGVSRDEIEPAINQDATGARLFSLSISPDGVPGWILGGVEYIGNIPAPEGDMREVDHTVFTSYTRGGFEMRSEWAEMHHTRFVDDRQFVTHGWYSLWSWRPRGRWKAVRPYMLFDHLNVASGEPYLSQVHNQRAWAAGVRWDAASRLAVKADYRAQLAPDGRHEHLVRMQVAVSF